MGSLVASSRPEIELESESVLAPCNVGFSVSSACVDVSSPMLHRYWCIHQHSWVAEAHGHYPGRRLLLIIGVSLFLEVAARASGNGQRSLYHVCG